MGRPGDTFRILPRSAWTATAKGGDRQTFRRGILYVHISESAADQINSKAEAAAALRSIRRFHVEGRGWSDIGYGYAIVQPRSPWRRARLYELRGKDRIPASQQGCNARNTSVVVLGTTRDRIRGSTRGHIRRLWRELGASTIRGHRECPEVGGQTDCPGDRLMAVVRQLRG